MSDFHKINNMRYLLFIPLLIIACTTNSNEVDIPNPFDSEYELNEQKSDLNGVSIYEAISDNFITFTIETNCKDLKTCPTVDIYVNHNFAENVIFSKNFDTAPVDLSDILLYPDGKCSVPFSVDSGMLDITKMENGNFEGSFNVQSREINGYSPDPTIGCEEENYSSEGIRTLTFEGTFISFESE